MDYAVVVVAAAPVRRKPMHRKEMINQLLFGEMVQVIKTKGDLWVKIRSLHDEYEGWMTHAMLQIVNKDGANNPIAFVTTDLLSTVFIGDKKIHVPCGSSLPFFENGNGMLGDTQYNFNGDYCKRSEQQPGIEILNKLTADWLNVPYLWGGRTPLGIDCSGFVQIIYKLLGIDLPRDAWQQAQEGKPVKNFGDSQPGDLAFFDNKEDIVHVGILLGDGKIIHCSGKVRIDNIDKKGIAKQAGITNTNLKAVRRYW
ncbi:MAG: C40 family peptidase [Ginsengibacter sp.]